MKGVFYFKTFFLGLGLVCFSGCSDDSASYTIEQLTMVNEQLVTNNRTLKSEIQKLKNEKKANASADAIFDNPNFDIVRYLVDAYDHSVAFAFEEVITHHMDSMAAPINPKTLTEIDELVEQANSSYNRYVSVQYERMTGRRFITMESLLILEELLAQISDYIPKLESSVTILKELLKGMPTPTQEGSYSLRKNTETGVITLNIDGETNSYDPRDEGNVYRKGTQINISAELKNAKFDPSKHIMKVSGPHVGSYFFLPIKGVNDDNALANEDLGVIADIWTGKRSFPLRRYLTNNFAYITGTSNQAYLVTNIKEIAIPASKSGNPSLMDADEANSWYIGKGKGENIKPVGIPEWLDKQVYVVEIDIANYSNLSKRALEKKIEERNPYIRGAILPASESLLLLQKGTAKDSAEWRDSFMKLWADLLIEAIEEDSLSY